MAGIFHGGGVAAAAARYGGRVEDWLDLSTGINPEMVALPDISTRVWNRLPDAELEFSARVAARDWYLGPAGRGDAPTGSDLPLPVPGTQALIQILPHLAPKNRPVAILSPTYGEYAHCFRKAGFEVDAINALADLRPEHGLLVVVNPNNPTGLSYGREELVALTARMRAQGGRLHVDEAFGDSWADVSVAAHAAVTEGLTVSRSFGKFFGLAGLRLGFVFAVPETLNTIAAALGPWPVSGPALHIASDVFRRDMAEFAARIDRRAAALQAVLDKAGLEIAGGTNLFKLVRHAAADRLFEHLARSHILVRRFDYAGDWLRVGLTPDKEGDRRLADALAAAGD